MNVKELVEHLPCECSTSLGDMHYCSGCRIRDEFERLNRAIESWKAEEELNMAELARLRKENRRTDAVALGRKGGRAQVKKVGVEQMRKWGRKGGKSRWAGMTAEERKAATEPARAARRKKKGEK